MDQGDRFSLRFNRIADRGRDQTIGTEAAHRFDTDTDFHFGPAQCGLKTEESFYRFLGSKPDFGEFLRKFFLQDAEKLLRLG